MKKKMITVVNETGVKQYLSFKNVKGGTFLSRGENRIDKEIWEKELSQGPWAKLLLERKELVVKGDKPKE